MKKLIIIILAMVFLLNSYSCSQNDREVYDFPIEVKHVVRGDSADTIIIKKTILHGRKRLD